MKRKTTSALLFILMFSGSCFAQNILHNNFSIRTGIAVPFADFADKTMDYQSGFAKTGYNIEGDYLIYWKRFGFCSSVGLTIMDFNQNAYESEYLRILGGNDIILNTGAYRIFKTTAGIVIKGPDFEFSQVLFHMQAGMAQTTHPELVVTHPVWGMINKVEQSSEWKSISSIGCIIRSDFSGKFGLTFSYNANFTKPWFRDDSNLPGGFYLPVRYHTFNMGIVIIL